MRSLLLFFYLLSIINLSFSQGYQPVGSKSASMAGASVTTSDLWAHFNNPGAISESKEIQVGFTYQNRFLLKDLQSQALVMVIPIKKGVFSFGTLHNGNKDFRTLRTGFGYALQLSKIFSLGVQLNHQFVQLPSYYGSKNAVTAELGFKAMINPKWSLGMSIFNIGRVKLSNYADDRLTTVLRIGSGYSISEKLRMTLEAEKNVEYPVAFKIGMDYNAVKNLYIRAGAKINPLLFSFGVGYEIKNWSLDAGTEWHTFLGWMPTFGVHYKFKNKVVESPTLDEIEK
jgi:hypothetical protein